MKGKSKVKKEGLRIVKMQSSGNDFIIIENPDKKIPTNILKELAHRLCRRRMSVGADGLLVWEKYKGLDGLMRIFNPDGSEPKMCGNGARCFALFLARKFNKNDIIFKTHSSVVFSNVKDSTVSIKMPDVKALKTLKVKSKSRTFSVDSLNTGVPHAVIFVKGVEKFDVLKYAPPIRYNLSLFPEGANVDFAEKTGDSTVRVRTYERGVEDETLSCGTGAVASSIVFARKFSKKEIHSVKVKTSSGEYVSSSFRNKGDNFFDIWLESEAHFIYEGNISEKQ